MFKFGFRPIGNSATFEEKTIDGLGNIRTLPKRPQELEVGRILLQSGGSETVPTQTHAAGLDDQFWKS